MSPTLLISLLSAGVLLPDLQLRDVCLLLPFGVPLPCVVRRAHLAEELLPEVGGLDLCRDLLEGCLAPRLLLKLGYRVAFSKGRLRRTSWTWWWFLSSPGELQAPRQGEGEHGDQMDDRLAAHSPAMITFLTLDREFR